MFKVWVKNYKALGSGGLRKISKYSTYTKEIKQAALQAYINREGSQNDVCRKIWICSKMQLQNWVKAYNGHKEIRSSIGKGSKIYMTKGRNTTYDERVEIVSYCIENGKDYAETIEKYCVSNQQTIHG